MTVRFGAQLWSQSTDWPRFRAAALEAEAAGWDSVWTWDHLMAIQGPWRQPIHEGWLALAAWAALTARIRLGLMVGANTFRNPGHTAKLATTLDHISAGRAVLGIGGAWFEREHEAFGIDFGAGFGERLDRLDESVGIIRRLLDGETVDHEGPAYRLHDAELQPRPIQDHLPILIGGSGPKKTLRTVARYGDAWNTWAHSTRWRRATPSCASTAPSSDATRPRSSGPSASRSSSGIDEPTRRARSTRCWPTIGSRAASRR